MLVTPNRSSVQKSVFDFLLALCFAVPAFIVCLFCSVLIFAETSAWPIFRQTRIGRDNREFEIYKLRTMSPGTPNVASHDVSSSQITKTGKVIRRLKFDELPQIINVLNGTMSFVGPRPCLPSQIELVHARTVLGVSTLKPGITGPGQIAGLDMSVPGALSVADATYLGHHSIADDLKYLLQTLLGHGRGDAALAAIERDPPKT